MRGICIDPGSCDAIEKNQAYYLFENGPNYFYVSRFDKKTAHFGCYKAEKFEVVVEDAAQKIKRPWPPEPPVFDPGLVEEKVYKARLIWRTYGYSGKELTEYYVKLAGKTHVFLYFDSGLKRSAGCFPVHWFRDFTEVDQPEEELQVVQEEEPPLLPVEEWEQLKLF